MGEEALIGLIVNIKEFMSLKIRDTYYDEVERKSIWKQIAGILKQSLKVSIFYICICFNKSM